MAKRAATHTSVTMTLRSHKAFPARGVASNVREEVFFSDPWGAWEFWDGITRGLFKKEYSFKSFILFPPTEGYMLPFSGGSSHLTSYSKPGARSHSSGSDVRVLRPSPVGTCHASQRRGQTPFHTSCVLLASVSVRLRGEDGKRASGCLLDVIIRVSHLQVEHTSINSRVYVHTPQWKGVQPLLHSWVSLGLVDQSTGLNGQHDHDKKGHPSAPALSLASNDKTFVGLLKHHSNETSA